MFCKYCGQTIDDDSVFCPHCGQNLIGKMETIQPLNRDNYIAVNRLFKRREETLREIDRWEEETYPGTVIWGFILSIIAFLITIAVMSAGAEMLVVGLCLIGPISFIPAVLCIRAHSSLLNKKLQTIEQLNEELESIDEELANLSGENTPEQQEKEQQVNPADPDTQSKE